MSRLDREKVENHRRQMLRLATEMARYSDADLAVCAADPDDRTNVLRVLDDARGAIRVASWSIARGALTREVRRLERALAQVGIAA